MKEPTGEKKADKDAVVQAITALKARGADVNPYTVAAEADVCRASLVRDPELMSLLARARQNGAANGRPPEGAQNQSTAAAHKLQQENEQLRQALSEARLMIQQLKQDVGRAAQETQLMARTINAAWQQGYLDGQQSTEGDTGTPAQGPPASQLEASEAATTYGATESATTGGAEQAPDQVDERSSTSEELAREIRANDELITAYVADVPLHIEDPEVLNDPFTAKLLNALQGAILESDGMQGPDLIDERLLSQPVQPRQLQPPPASPWNDQTETLQSMEAHLPNSSADHVDGDLDEGTEFEGPDGSRMRFTAEELHDLFRNKYVKPDESSDAIPKPPIKNNENSQVMKKFVGANKPSTGSEPLPTVPRAFPPDIRRACRLLGMNPEDISKVVVLDAWKREMSKPGVHPDTGGDTEMAIYLNTAKDVLLRWAEDQAPKLGKKFGQKGGDPKHPPRQE